MFSAQHKFGRLGAPAGRSIEAAIRALFSDGVIYDPSDLTTLFTDAAGTTPVTALEQPVGLMLDKSRGLVLGSELVTNGDFSSATGWTLSSGATISGGLLAFNSVASTAGATQPDYVSLPANSFAKVVVVVTGLTAGQFRVKLKGGSYVLVPASVGTHTLYVPVGSSTTYGLELHAAGTTSGTIDSISVRELPGYHAYHPPGDTTTRPVVSRRINLLTKTEQFDDGAWAKTNSSISKDAAVAPDETTTADKIIEDSTNQTHGTYYSGSVSVAAGQVTFSAYLKAAERNYGGITAVDGGNNRYYLVANLQDGTEIASGSSIGSPSLVSKSITGVGSGWYKLQITLTSASGSPFMWVYPQNDSSFSTTPTGAAVYQGDGTSGIYIWGASLVPADLSALPYQRVNTTTDYDSDASKFPTFLRTDGANDGMQTNAIDFTGTDKMFVGAAVRKLSDAAAGMLVELSATIGANAGAFALQAPNSSTNSYRVESRGTSAASQVNVTGQAAPITNVLVGLCDISGDSLVVRINGAQAGSSTSDQGTGNFGTYKLYLFMRGGSGLPFNGWMFGALIKGSTLSASQIALAERWLASKTKTVTL